MTSTVAKEAPVAEVLARFDDPMTVDGVTYRVQACGAPMSDNLWEGWLEFIPVDGRTPIRSPRETTQPNRQDAEYWATGLTAVYFEGSLRRALSPIVRKPQPPPAAPAFERPARGIVVERADVAPPEAVLDPFSVYQKGESLLRKELSALSAWHLVNIIRAYRLTDDGDTTLNHLPTPALIDRIISAVRAQSPASR